MNKSGSSLLKSLLITTFALSVSCGGKSKSKKAELGDDKNQSIVLDLPKIEPKESRFPRQEPVVDLKDEFVMNIMDENSSFEDPISLIFEKESSWFGSSKYFLTKAYIGSTDDSKFLFFFGEDDDVALKGIWKSISVDLRSFYLYGEKQSGEEVVIGYVHKTAHNQLKIEFVSKYEINKENQTLSILEPEEVLIEEVTTCPLVIEKTSDVACSAYIGLYNVLTSIDYQAMGQVGPRVAKSVVSAKTVLKMVTSYFDFTPDVDTIRDEFLVPILKSVTNLKKLQELDKENKKLYLDKTGSAYSDLIVVSMDSVVKIQKMAPEAFQGLSGVAFGSALAYLGAEEAGDKAISKKQPEWFRQVVAPIIREFGVLSIDLILNGSQTSLEARLKRFVSMEAQVRSAVVSLCKSAKANECKEALAL